MALPKPQMKIPKQQQQPVRVSPGVYRQPGGALTRPAGGVLPPQQGKPNPLKSQPVGNFRPVQIPGGEQPPRLGVQPTAPGGSGGWGNPEDISHTAVMPRRTGGGGWGNLEDISHTAVIPSGPGGFDENMRPKGFPGSDMTSIEDFIRQFQARQAAAGGAAAGAFRKSNIGGAPGVSGQVNPFDDQAMKLT